MRDLLVVFYGNRGLSALLIKLFIPTYRLYNLHLLFGDGSYLALNHDIRTQIGTVFTVMVLLVVALGGYFWINRYLSLSKARSRGD